MTNPTLFWSCHIDSKVGIATLCNPSTLCNMTNKHISLKVKLFYKDVAKPETFKTWNTVWSEAELFYLKHLQHLPDLELVIMAVKGHVVDVYLRLMVTLWSVFPAWEPPGCSQLQRSAIGQSHRFWWCCPAQQCPLQSPFAGQPWVCLPRVGPWRAGVADLWPVEPWCGDLCAAERSLPLPRWKRRGDVPEHLPARLQLPQGLLPGRQPDSPGLHLPASEDRPRQKASSRALPSGAVAAGRAGWRPGQSRWLPGHLPPHLLHRQEETSDWCPGHRRRQELHPKSPSAPSLMDGINKSKQPSLPTASCLIMADKSWVTGQSWGWRGCRFLWSLASWWSRCKRRNNECRSYPLSQNADLLKSCSPFTN